MRHLGIAQSGTMRITHDDGTTAEIGPGETYVIEPGHQAEVIGNETFVGFDFSRSQPRGTQNPRRLVAASVLRLSLEMEFGRTEAALGSSFTSTFRSSIRSGPT